MPYLFIDHTADLGIRVRAKSIQGLFLDAGRAIVDILDAATEPGTEEIEMNLNGLDRVDLLVRWLQEVVYIIEVKDFRISHILITALSETELSARITGVTTRSPLAREIKAVTYHDLTIHEIDNHLETTIILDT